MRKLFEIPIYSFGKSVLIQKVRQFSIQYYHKYKDYGDETVKRCYNAETYPQRLWDYNHIVGYIQIALDQDDISFEIFLPETSVSRYNWKSKRKIFLYNINATGLYVHLNDNMGDLEIREKIGKMLDFIQMKYIPKRFFVDRQAFDQLNPVISYIELLKQYNAQK